MVCLGSRIFQLPQQFEHMTDHVYQCVFKFFNAWQPSIPPYTYCQLCIVKTALHEMLVYMYKYIHDMLL